MIVSRDIKTFLEWLKLRELGTGEFPRDTDTLILAARKSALLQRMLEGKSPLKEPPPKAYSYPWYQLIEEGIGYAYDVWEPDSEIETTFLENKIVIEQFPWDLIRKVGPQHWIVTYHFGPDLQTKATGEWEVKRQNDMWLIKKII